MILEFDSEHTHTYSRAIAHMYPPPTLTEDSADLVKCQGKAWSLGGGAGLHAGRDSERACELEGTGAPIEGRGNQDEEDTCSEPPYAVMAYAIKKLGESSKKSHSGLAGARSVVEKHIAVV